MTGESSTSPMESECHSPPISSPLERESGLRAARARRDMVVCPHGKSWPLPASDATPPTPQSSKPWRGYAEEHLERALKELELSADVFWNEARSRSTTAVRARQLVWEWMRKTPLPFGSLLTLEQIGEATGGYDHTTVMCGLKAKERRDASVNTTHKRNLR